MTSLKRQLITAIIIILAIIMLMIAMRTVYAAEYEDGDCYYRTEYRQAYTRTRCLPGSFRCHPVTVRVCK